MAAEKPTQSQLIGQAMSDKAVGSGKVSAAEVAQKVFDAVRSGTVLHLQPPTSLGLGGPTDASGGGGDKPT